MATVGYELYTQLIQQEIELLKAFADGEALPETRNPLEGLEPLPAVDLPVSAYIPQGYIPDQAQRLFYYKRIMSCRSFEELTDAEQEIQDRYGKLPTQVASAFAIMRLRLKCLDLKIEKVTTQMGQLVLYFYQANSLSPRLVHLLQKYNKEAHTAQKKFFWPYSGNPLQICKKVFQLLENTLMQLEDQRLSLQAP
jgi:transcription-repair coupling factor (superfamily II helicase)